jgi:hypothetical protein
MPNPQQTAAPTSDIDLSAGLVPQQSTAASTPSASANDIDLSAGLVPTSNTNPDTVMIGGKPVNLKTGAGAIEASQAQARPTPAAPVVKYAHEDPIDVLASQTPITDRINKGLKEGVEAGFGLHDVDATEHPYVTTLQDTWNNLKNSAKQSYARMGGAPELNPYSAPVGQTLKSIGATALTPVDMLASGIEGMSNLIDSGSKEMLAGAKAKDPQQIARGFAKILSGAGQAAAGMEAPDAVAGGVDAAKSVAGKVGDVADDIQQSRAASQAAKVAQQATDLENQKLADLKQAAPPAKRANWTDEDYQAAKPLLEPEHANALQAGDSGLTAWKTAADAVKDNIEDTVADEIAKRPDVKIQSPVADIKAQLATHPRGEAFVNAGLKAIEDYKPDEAKTLAQADQIRRTLNAENDMFNNGMPFDRYKAKLTNPAYAARDAYASALRDGIYNELPGMQDLRRAEGSVIKIGRAVERQLLNGAKVVRGSVKPSLIRKVAGKSADAATTAAGVGIGGATGIPGAGYIGGVLGHEAGKMIDRAIQPSPLTRDELADRAAGVKP